MSEICWPSGVLNENPPSAVTAGPSGPCALGEPLSCADIPLPVS